MDIDNLRSLVIDLHNEGRPYQPCVVPSDPDELLEDWRYLVNIRDPNPIDDEILKKEDILLDQLLSQRTLVTIDQLNEVMKEIYIYKGDITNLKVESIVNAANSQALGCFRPHHHCIDNAIHTFSGMRLRLKCDEIMQGGELGVSECFITPAYHLPSDYVIHAVGPYVPDTVTEEHIDLLRRTYQNILDLCTKNNISTVAFCSISTGVFNFPIKLASKIAIETVLNYKKEHDSHIKVIFNLFSENDFNIYMKALNDLSQ